MPYYSCPDLLDPEAVASCSQPSRPPSRQQQSRNYGATGKTLDALRETGDDGGEDGAIRETAPLLGSGDEPIDSWKIVG